MRIQQSPSSIDCFYWIRHCYYFCSPSIIINLIVVVLFGKIHFLFLIFTFISSHLTEYSLCLKRECGGWSTKENDSKCPIFSIAKAKEWWLINWMQIKSKMLSHAFFFSRSHLIKWNSNSPHYGVDLIYLLPIISLNF